MCLAYNDNTEQFECSYANKQKTKTKTLSNGLEAWSASSCFVFIFRYVFVLVNSILLFTDSVRENYNIIFHMQVII